MKAVVKQDVKKCWSQFDSILFSACFTRLSSPLVQRYYWYSDIRQSATVCKCARMCCLRIMEIRHVPKCCRGTGSSEKLGHAPRGGYRQRQQLHTSAKQTITTEICVTTKKLHRGHFLLLAFFFFAAPFLSLTGFPLSCIITK